MGIRGGKRFRETWGADLPGAGDLNVTEVNAFKDRVLAPLFCHAGAFPSGGSDDSRHDRSGAYAACRLQGRGNSWKAIRSIYKNRGTPTGKYGQVYGLVTELLKAPVRSSGRGAREPERVSGNSGCRLCGAEGRCYSGGGKTRLWWDITRTRLAHIGAFFAGVNDGIVPAKKRAGKPAFRP